MISVIVPVYKSEKYLSDCVDSILNQTFCDLEVILVDDGSPDNCPEICDDYAKKDYRVKVIHKQNGGVSSARNAGLDIASGEYVAFVDSDDYLDANMYQMMMDTADKYNCDIVLCDCVKEFPSKSCIYSHSIRGGFYDKAQLQHEYYPHLLMMENVEYPATISNCLLLFRRELSDRVRYLVGVRYSEDLLFGAQLMINAESFFYMKEEALYHYRMNPESATHRFVPDKWNDYMKLHIEITNVFRSYREFDFSDQVDLCLLFFMYNSVGDLYTAPLGRQKKKQAIKDILKTPEISVMFKRINIRKLPITFKQKLITFMYRHRIGISALIWYYGC